MDTIISIEEFNGVLNSNDDQSPLFVALRKILNADRDVVVASIESPLWSWFGWDMPGIGWDIPGIVPQTAVP